MDQLQVPTLHRDNSVSSTSEISSISSVSSSSPLNAPNYSLSPKDIASLHDPKSLQALESMGGISGLISLLRSDHKAGLNDLNAEDISNRKKFYGENVLPIRAQKSFLRLCWEALHDQVLIVLMIAALVSLALGLYTTLGVPTQYDDEGLAMPKLDWVEGVAIIVAVLIVVLVGAANDYQKERQFAALNAKKEDRELIVIRNGGGQKLISIHELLVGDILNLQTGDVVPADLVLLDGQIECDESALTGESDTIKKKPAKSCSKYYKDNTDAYPGEDIGSTKFKFKDPMLISGSKVLSGLGNAIVAAVGENSINGRTMMSLRHEPETTPLQERLDGLANGISKYGLLAALLLFIICFIRFCVNIAPGGSEHELGGPEKGKAFLDILITAITIVVVAIPEGLPLAVTLALAFATTRMAQNGNLVRILKSCETMGGATAICSDKTGTLTENKMRVVRGFVGGQLEFDDSVSALGDISKFDDDFKVKIGSSVTENLVRNITLNSTAFANSEVRTPQQQEDEEKQKQAQKEKDSHSFFGFMSNMVKNQSRDYQKELIEAIAKGEPYLGNKTETALLILANDKMNSFATDTLDDIRRQYRHEIVEVIPFESSRKWAGIVVRIKNGYRLYVKGAAEIVFKNCGFQYNEDCTEIIKIDNRDMREKVLYKIDEYANDALRAIALAHKDFPGIKSWPPDEFPMSLNVNQLAEKVWTYTTNCNGEVEDKEEGIMRSFTLDAILGIQDPLKEGVPDAVLKCKKAGVNVRMVTGDNLITAKAISKECQILTSDDLTSEFAAMEGTTFRKLSIERRKEIVPQLKVLARASPEDKRILVDTLRKLGEVVAVTGDGTNDAPALKLADVGFSMGIAGTEVAREASDIILMTDNFNDIVQAIKWGRTVSTSIKKFIQFQLTVNITACVLTFVSAVVSSEGVSVLTAVQLLWVNLIMDTLAALALATDKPDELLLNRKPNGRHTPLISVSMWKMIIGQSLLQLLITFNLYFHGRKIFFDRETDNYEDKQLGALTFNTFVWLQFFKLVVTRKLDEADGISRVRDRITAENLNFFQHFFRNWYFLAIIAIIGGFQVLIMFVGGAAFSVQRQTPAMWATAIICGLLSLPIGIIIRIIPDEWVIAIFPTRFFNAFIYCVLFKWLRKNKGEDLEKGEDDESPASSLPSDQSHIKVERS